MKEKIWRVLAQILYYHNESIDLIKPFFENLNNENIDKIFTQELINRSVKTQIQLLTKAEKILKKGGEIVYSTCSILKEENEEIVEKILQLGEVELEEIDETFIDVPFLSTKIKGTLCIRPTELYEGFFVAKICKKIRG